MPLTLGDLCTAVWDASPWFSRERVPAGVLARWASREQNRIIARVAREGNPHYVAQQASIVFALDAANAVGTAGAGTTGGVPAEETAGTLAAVEAAAGAAAELAHDAAVLVPAFAVAAPSLTSLTKTGAAWGVNAYVGQVVRIAAGPGQGQRRTITANTADTISFAALDTAPTVESLAEIVAGTTVVDDDFAVVTALGPTADRLGYLVKLDASGNPYLDLGSPLVATYDVGAALPPMIQLVGNGCTVRYTPSSGRGPTPLRLTSGGLRHYESGQPSAYVEGGRLYFAGDGREWTDAAAIDLRYVPIAPALTRLTDYLLLPDAALGYLAACGAHYAATRVAVLPEVKDALGPDGVRTLLAEVRTREVDESDDFYASVRAATPARVFRQRAVW